MITKSTFQGKLFSRNYLNQGRTYWRCLDRDCAGSAHSIPLGVNNQLEITLQTNHTTCSTTDVDAIVMYYKNQVLKQIVTNTSAVEKKQKETVDLFHIVCALGIFPFFGNRVK